MAIYSTQCKNMVDFDWLVAELWTGEVCWHAKNGLCLRFFFWSHLLCTKELVDSTVDGKKIIVARGVSLE